MHWGAYSDLTIGKKGEEMQGEEDFIDAALNLDQTHLKQGFDEGFAEGVVLGEVEGREVGLRAGFEVGEELGFYSGCADVWVAVIQKDETGFSVRARRSIQQLQELVRAYPALEPEDESLQERLEVIRAKFRAVTSMLGVSLQYPGLSRAEDSSF